MIKKPNAKGINEIYRYYFNTYHKPYKEKISIKIFSDIFTGFNEFIMEKVINGDEIVLPCRTGRLYVQGVKRKIRYNEKGEIRGLPPNWKETIKFWNINAEAKAKKKIIYFTNDRTGGITYKFFWSRLNIYAKNKFFYSLRVSTKQKKALSKLILSGKKYKVKQGDNENRLRN